LITADEIIPGKRKKDNYLRGLPKLLVTTVDSVEVVVLQYWLHTGLSLHICVRQVTKSSRRPLCLWIISRNFGQKPMSVRTTLN